LATPSRLAPTKLRVGLYACISVQDQQTIPMQIRALRDYAARRRWTIVLQTKEVGSGVSQRELRERLPDAARRNRLEQASQSDVEAGTNPTRIRQPLFVAGTLGRVIEL